MKRKRKIAKPKPVSLRDQVGSLRRLYDEIIQRIASVQANQNQLSKEGGETRILVGSTCEAIKALQTIPMGVVGQVDRILKKLEDTGIERAENIDRIFPDICKQFNAMAEAVNKITAYAKALDESEAAYRLRAETRGRIAEETDEQLLAKLKHRLARMEQKL